ncbi:hypothetical protein, conserved in T. vivax [Trypanosoma vivax Y486]|uniref:Uncharacterized protein n=1 Tax=Trypanosoma vivax (strain Y486) TaxID=1055687 RepID=F9WTB7_TRYVY|nr:hypothetical protein, conserved in T. vivax [Trypanosoma vivax Y486]|eukprot:CCD20810.1 hypothetical protein, conserved in T. vivax [Trypanosoma vivax Y486]
MHSRGARKHATHATTDKGAHEKGQRPAHSRHRPNRQPHRTATHTTGRPTHGTTEQHAPHKKPCLFKMESTEAGTT